MNESIKKEIIEWNNRFPIDKWWRDKHNIAFNTPKHREISFLDQLFEYYEDQVFEEHYNSKDYQPNNGDWLKKQERTEPERLISLEEEARKELSNLPEKF